MSADIPREMDRLVRSAFALGESLADFYDSLHGGKEPWYDHRFDWLAGPLRWTRWERAVYGARYIRPGDRVLDLCCGDGFFSWIYSLRAKWVLGMDRNEGAIALAQRLYSGENCHFICGDILEKESLPQCDLAIWWDGIEHFGELEASYIMHRIHVALRNSDNGRLVGSTPIAREQKSNPEHQREFKDTDDLRNFLGQWFQGVEIWTSPWGRNRTQMYFVCR